MTLRAVKDPLDAHTLQAALALAQAAKDPELADLVAELVGEHAREYAGCVELLAALGVLAGLVRGQTAASDSDPETLWRLHELLIEPSEAAAGPASGDPELATSMVALPDTPELREARRLLLPHEQQRASAFEVIRAGFFLPSPGAAWRNTVELEPAVWAAASPLARDYAPAKAMIPLLLAGWALLSLTEQCARAVALEPAAVLARVGLTLAQRPA